MGSDIQIRTARDEDIERLISIHMTAFPDARNRDQRRRNFVENMRGPLADLCVAERGGALLAHAFLFRMATWIGGNEIGMGGVASVGVAPEARGQGIARKLMQHMLADLHRKRTPLCLLYPFRHHFYGKLGFATVSEVKRLRVPTKALPNTATNLVLRAATRPEDFALARRCYERWGEKQTGLVVRRESIWRALFALEGRHLTLVSTPQGDVVGYSMHAYLWPPEGMPQEIDVTEMVAETDEARLALLSFFGRQQDQSTYVRLLLDVHDPLLAFVDEPRSASFDSIRTLIPIAGEVGSGAMLRLVDVGAALLARGYANNGSLGLDVRDNESAAFRGTLHVERGQARLQNEIVGPTLATDAATLAQLYTGFVRVRDAIRFRRATVSDPDAIQIAEDLFAGPRFMTLDYF